MPSSYMKNEPLCTSTCDACINGHASSEGHGNAAAYHGTRRASIGSGSAMTALASISSDLYAVCSRCNYTSAM